ncbi:MAG: transporter substrate-binding domain-containing protein [Verrucomicrobiales bacterium]|nr:transporter substrate-binding domain-containing protein [Verrucomicrobiales bacterium]
MRTWFLTVFFLIPLPFFAGCGGDQAGRGELGDGKPLIVGMSLTYPPFEIRTNQNEPDGISVHMAEGLAEYLGRPLEIRDVEWNGIIPALQSGKIDVIISSMTRTEEREKAIAFSDGYVTNGLCMLVAKDSAIQSAGDLEAGDYKAAVRIGTTGHQWARKEAPSLELILLDDTAACVLEVVQGKADAFIFDQISVYENWQKNPKTTRPILNPIREETWAIGMRKEDKALKIKVNEFLADFRTRGRFEELSDQYMSDAKAAFEEMGVPFIFH